MRGRREEIYEFAVTARRLRASAYSPVLLRKRVRGGKGDASVGTTLEIDRDVALRLINVYPAADRSLRRRCSRETSRERRDVSLSTSDFILSASSSVSDRSALSTPPHRRHRGSSRASELASTISHSDRERRYHWRLISVARSEC